MTYQLRPSVAYSATRELVSFRHRGETLTVRGGPAIYYLLRRLMPLLREGADKEAILTSVPLTSRPAVSSLLAELAARRMVWKQDDLTLPAPSEEERALHRGTLSYLESRSDDPYAAFDNFRNSLLLAIGTGRSHSVLVRCLGSMGARKVYGQPFAVTLPRPPQGDDVSLPDPAAQDGGPDRGLGWLVSKEGSMPVILHVRDGLDVDEIRRVEALASEQGLWILQGVAMGSLGLWCVVGENSREPGLVDAVDRLAARGHLALGDRSSGRTSDRVAELVGTFAAMEALDLISGLGARTGRGRIGILRANSLESSYRTLIAAPALNGRDKGAIVDAHRRFKALQHPCAIGSVLEKASDLTDNMVGLLPEPEPGNLSQVPLNVFSIVLSGASQPDPHQVFGFGSNEEEAHFNTLVEGVKLLAGRTLAPSQNTVDMLHVGCPNQEGVVEADRSDVVLAAGRSYQAWLADGLCRSMLRRFVAGRASGMKLVDGVARSPARISGSGQRWLRLLGLLVDGQVSVRVSSWSDTALLYFGETLVNDEVWAVGLGTAKDEAASNALISGLARAQVAKDGVRTPVDPLFGIPTGLESLRSKRQGNGHASNDAWLKRMLDALPRYGLKAAACPLDEVLPLRDCGLLLGLVGVVPRA